MQVTSLMAGYKPGEANVRHDDDDTVGRVHRSSSRRDQVAGTVMNLLGHVSARLHMVRNRAQELPARVAETWRPDNIGTGEGMTLASGCARKRRGRFSSLAA